jgi:hypothetical protein
VGWAEAMRAEPETVWAVRFLYWWEQEGGRGTVTGIVLIFLRRYWCYAEICILDTGRDSEARRGRIWRFGLSYEHLKARLKIEESI